MRNLALILLTFMLPLNLFAGNWKSTNIQLQWATDHKTDSPSVNPDKEFTTLNLTHANSWEYGSNYFFVDFNKLDTEASSIYSEFTPRISLNKLTGRKLGNSFIEDYRLVYTWEIASGSKTRRLYGLGLKLNIPKTKFFLIDLLSRDNPDYEGQTHQITIAWLMPFKFGNYDFTFSGFMDLAGEEGSGSTIAEANNHISPQVFMDLSKLWGKNGLWIGMEIDYWTNKFGIKNYDENANRMILKWVF